MSYHIHLVGTTTANIEIDGKIEEVNVAYHGWDTRDSEHPSSARKSGAHDKAWKGKAERPSFVVLRYRDKNISEGCDVYKVDRLTSFWETPINSDQKNSKYLGTIKKQGRKWVLVPAAK